MRKRRGLILMQRVSPEMGAFKLKFKVLHSWWELR